MPKQFMRLINDYNIDNLNMMNALELHKLFKYVREMAEALEESESTINSLNRDLCGEYCTSKECWDSNHTLSHEKIEVLEKFKEWK